MYNGPMKKMKNRIWLAGTAAATLLTAASVSFAVAEEQLSMPMPAVTETTASPGTATIEETPTPQVEVEATPQDGERYIPEGHTADEADEFLKEHIVEEVLPTVTLFGEMDGNVFNGSIYVDATAASGPLENLTIQVILPVLLEDGSTFEVFDLPFQKTSLGITNTQSVPVSFDLTTLVDRWSAEGTTVRRNGGDILIASVSKLVEISVHPSYEHSDPAIGLTGFAGPVKNLTRG